MLTKDNIIYLNKIFKLLTKLLGIIIYAYFIFQVKHYQVQWNFLISYFPGVCGNINNFLSAIGTYILIIPLVVIITSFFFPEVVWLQIMTTIFALGGGIFGVVTSAYQNTLGTFINLRFLAISHILTLNEKQDIFVTRYNLCTEQYKAMTEKFNFFLVHLQEQYFIAEYNPILMTLNSLLEIERYANSVCTKLSLDYETTIQPIKNSDINYKKYVVITLVVGGILLLAYFYLNISVEAAVVTSGELQGAVNNTAAAIGDVVTATAQATLAQSEQMLALIQTNVATLGALEDKHNALVKSVRRLYAEILPPLLESLRSVDQRTAHIDVINRLLENTP